MHLVLDERGIPTGKEADEPREDERIGRRTFDDLHRLGWDRELAFEADDGASIAVRPGRGYTHAQVRVPAGHPFAALEPMAAATKSLVDETSPLVEPDESFTAEFTIAITASE